jgi:hypothetical protein
VVVIFHFTDSLSLWYNSLTGSIPSEIALLTNLGESSVVWLLVVTIGVVFFMVLTCGRNFSFYRFVVSLEQ